MGRRGRRGRRGESEVRGKREEVSEAYGADWTDRNKYWGVVAAVGGFSWAKTPKETEHYCDLVTVARVAI